MSWTGKTDDKNSSPNSGLKNSSPSTSPVLEKIKIQVQVQVQYWKI